MSSQLGLFSHETVAESITPTGFSARDYQQEGIDKTFDLFSQGIKGVIVRQATGCGKTVVGSLIAQRWINQGPNYHAMVVSHERQLIWQFAQEIKDVLGYHPSIEMASRSTSVSPLPKMVVASRQTLRCAIEEGPDGQPQPRSRLFKFDNDLNWLLIIDEVHRWAYKLRTCKHILDWFDANPKSRRIGLTATPHRGDGVSLRRVCPAVSSDYPLFSIDETKPSAVRDGWAVPYDQRFIKVESLDFKNIEEVRGDFDEEELDRILNQKAALAKMVEPLLDLVGTRQTIVFCTSVSMAKEVASQINAEIDARVQDGVQSACSQGSAKYLHGGVPDIVRRQTYLDHQSKRFQFLCVCGLCREGYNDPNVSCIAVFRPTKSRTLAEQMKGRGCRPLRGLVDGLSNREERLKAIAESEKPDTMIIDLVGVSGLADSASTAAILGEGLPDEAIEIANDILLKNNSRSDMSDVLKLADEELQKRREEARLAREREEQLLKEAAERRAKLRANVKYSVSARGVGSGVPKSKNALATSKQKYRIRQFGIQFDEKRLTKKQAGRIIGQIVSGKGKKYILSKNKIPLPGNEKRKETKTKLPAGAGDSFFDEIFGALGRD